MHLLEDLNDKQTDLISEEKRLVENLQFLNAILSGESGMGGQKPTFHNSPQGGAEGESNPVQIPDDAPQPGGGAQAEARKPRTASSGGPAIPPPTGYYNRKGKQTPFPVLSPDATPLPMQPGYPKNPFSGVSEGRGVGTMVQSKPRPAAERAGVARS